MRTRDDIFTQVLVRNNRSTTDTFITEEMMKDWFEDAHTWAASHHKWPFTEGRVETTFATGSGPNTDEWYFEGYKADSFRILYVGGKRFTKTNFEDYLTFREEEASGVDRVFSDFGRTVRVNPNADASGTMVAYGQYQPVVDVTDETGTTVFSDWDAEGNEAIVEKMSSYLKRRETMPKEAEMHDARAAAKLDVVWKKIQDEQHKYQTHDSTGGIFKRINVIEGNTYKDSITETQF